MARRDRWGQRRRLRSRSLHLGHADDLLRLLATIDYAASPRRRHSWCSTSDCPIRRLRCDAAGGRPRGMLQVHCEDPVLLDAAVAQALQRGNTPPRHHAVSRPAYVEAVATARALAFARATDSPVHVAAIFRRPRHSTKCAAPAWPASACRRRPVLTTWSSPTSATTTRIPSAAPAT